MVAAVAAAAVAAAAVDVAAAAAGAAAGMLQTVRLVLPGKYTVTITIPGVSQPLRGSVTVEADPMDASFTLADRRARQDVLLQVYALQKKLGAARTAAAGKADGAGEQQVRLQAEIERLIGLTGTLMRGIESFNTVPTADERQQLAWATDDATKVFAKLGLTAPRNP